MHRPNPATKRRCARVHPTGAGVGRRRGFVPYRLDSSPHRRRGVGLACWTQDEIAESEGISKGEISGICSEFPELEILNKSSQTLATYTYRLLESAEIRRNIFSPTGENMLQPIPERQLRPLAALPDPDPIFA